MGSLLSMRHQINELITHINGAALAEPEGSESLISKITKTVAAYYGVSFDDLVSGKRLKEPASSVKHVAIHFCVKEPSLNTHDIKTFFHLSAYQSIYYAEINVATAIAGKQVGKRLVQHIKAIDLQILSTYINEKLKQ